MNAPLPPQPKKKKETDLEGGDVDSVLEEGAPKVIEKLYHIAMNEDEEASKGQQLKAIELFLDRALGKAAQHVDMTHNTNEVLSIIMQGADPTVDLEDVIDHDPEAAAGGIGELVKKHH
jgi:hypothetical protein